MLRIDVGILGVLAALLIGGAANAAGEGADATRSVLEYAAWAEEALAATPAGIRLLPALEDRLVGRVDEQRSEENLRAVEIDAGLQRAARAHAIDMLARDYLDHTGPDGRSVADRVGILHRRFIGVTGENLAEQTGVAQQAVAEQIGPLALKLMNGFLQSPEHRKNLLNPDYTHQGIGAVAADDRLIVVHVFGDRRAALAEDLPLQVAAGAKLPLAFQAGEGLSTPAKYGFAHPGQLSAEVVPLDVAINEVAVEPGIWQLEFFLPTDRSDRFLVAPGPILAVQ